MKSYGSFFGLVFTSMLLGILPAWSQDQPDGFASVSGMGLETTTGGQGGDVVLVQTLADLQTHAQSPDPLILLVNGVIETEEWAEVNVSSNKTIVGYGDDATLKNIELHLIDIQNVIIRNLTIRDSYVMGDWDGKTNDYDAIQADNTHHLWIDHCHLAHCGDGLMDLRHACDHVTVSWVHLSNHNKAFGIGWTEENDWRMTIHHCWFDATGTRNPSFGNGFGHLYNNYLNGINSYGNLARGDAQLVIENSYYYRVNEPLGISDNGIIFSSGNLFENCWLNQEGNTAEMPFDPAGYYEYTLDPAESVDSIVPAGAGTHASIGDQYTQSMDKHDLTVSVAGGMGEIIPGNGRFIDGGLVRIQAVPEEGWLFDHWSGDLEGTSSDTTLLMDRDKFVSAHFMEDTTQQTAVDRVNSETPVSYGFVPATGDLLVRSRTVKELQIAVYSLDGRMVYMSGHTVPRQLRIPLGHLPEGLYILRFEADHAVSTGRIILP